MGCGGSRDGGDKEIDYAMEFVPAPDINAFFSTCEEVLKQAEELRAGWEDSLEEMYDLSSVCFLKAPPTLVDAVKVWIWTLAANNEGDINKCKPGVQKESPYLDCDLGKECSSCHNSANIYHTGCAMNQCSKFKEALKTYIQTCIEGAKNLPDLLKKLADLAEQAGGLKDKAKTALDGLGALDKAKALGKIAKNTAKLTKGMGKLKNVQPLVPEAVKNMEGVIKEFQEILKTANDVAKKAVDKKLTLPADIMQVCHPAEKHTEAQIKKMKEEAEKQRKADEEAKKKKADLMAKFEEAKKLLSEKK